MLWLAVIVLLALWTLGFGVAESVVGGWIHVLLVIAAIVLILQVARGRYV